jgi:hypothetical protein
MKFTGRSVAYILGFVIILFGGDRLASYFLKNFVVDRSQLRYTQLYHGGADAEILLVGNSRGLSFYQPFIEQATGRSTFNLSYNGLPTNLALVFFKDYLRLNGNPKLVLFEMTMRGNRTELIGNFGCYSPYSQDLARIMLAETPSIGRFNQIFHLTRYNGEVFQRSLYHLNEPDTAWLSTATIPERALQYKKTRQVPAEFDQMAAQDYKEMVRICKENGIQYKLVVNPYLPDYRQRMTDFDSMLKSLREFIGEPIRDYSLTISGHESFSDPMHTNKNGSRDYMKLLFEDKIFEIEQ